MYTPLMYSQINIIEGSYFPSQIHTCNNLTYDYWMRTLFQKAQSVIEFKNLPEGWTGSVKDFLFWCLFCRGFVAGFNSEEVGLAFQPCGLYGQNFYYQPVEAIISNPALKTPSDGLRLKIDEECVIIKLTPDYRGIWDVLSYYAEELSSMKTTLNMSIENGKVPFVLGAKSKPMAQLLKKIFDKVQRGESLVVYDDVFKEEASKSTKAASDNPFAAFDREHLKQSYLVTENLQDMQTILNNFYNEIGIPTVPYQKQERMVDAEATSRKIASSSRLAVWIDCLTDGFDKFNAMFGTDIRVEKRFNIDEKEDESNELG